MDDEIKKLMGVANLRNLAIEWNHSGIEHLSKMDENGESLIYKGWADKETYGKIFDEDFQQAALNRIANRQRNEENGQTTRSSNVHNIANEEEEKSSSSSEDDSSDEEEERSDEDKDSSTREEREDEEENAGVSTTSSAVVEPVSSRGRTIRAPVRDGAPITEGSTYRRKEG